MNARMTHFSRLLGILLILSMISCGRVAGLIGTPTGAPLDLSARLNELQGTVEVNNPEQGGFSPAADGTRLEVLGQVRTGPESHLRLDLSTGTTIRAAANSQFVLQSNEAKEGSLVTRLVVNAGQVWVILHGGRVDIDTPSGTASVRGSYMSVRVDPLTEDVWVTCLEGWCKAENPTATMDLVAGQGASLYHWNSAGSVPPPPPKLRYLSPDDVDQFLKNNPEARQVIDDYSATASALPTFTPTTASMPVTDCFDLLSPLQGAEQPAEGTLTLDWNDQPDVYKYIITIRKPTGAEISQITWKSSIQIDAASLPFAGTYQWQVTAYDSDIQPICSAGPWTFTKTASPTPTPVPDCFQLSGPDGVVDVSQSEPLTFTWGEQPDRYKFIITIIKPDGSEDAQIDFANNYQLPAGSLTQAGTYQWRVTAYDSNIQPICSAGPRTFVVPGASLPTPTPGGCVTLLTPADGTNFPDPARVDFTWTEYPGAYKYIITFKPPTTPAYTFLAWTPIHTRYVESFTAGGTYKWWVTVKDSRVQDICNSQVFTFTKPETILPTSTPPPNGGGAGENGLFWNRNVSINGCTVSASADTSYPSGVKKFTLSTSPVPPTTPYTVLSSLGGTTYGGSVNLTDIVSGLPSGKVFGRLPVNPILISLPSAPYACTTIPVGTTLYWRFEIFDGDYIPDNYIGSLTTIQDCP